MYSRQAFLNAATSPAGFVHCSRAAFARRDFLKALERLEEEERAAAMYRGLGALAAAAHVESRFPALIAAAQKEGRRLVAEVNQTQERAARFAFSR